MNTLDPILTVPEVARYLKISRSKAYALVAQRMLPAVKIGRNVRVRQEDLLVWLEEQAQVQIGSPLMARDYQ